MKFVVANLAEAIFPEGCVVCGDARTERVTTSCKAATSGAVLGPVIVYTQQTATITYPLCDKHRVRTLVPRLLALRNIGMLVVMTVLWIWFILFFAMYLAYWLGEPRPDNVPSITDDVPIWAMILPGFFIVARFVSRRTTPIYLQEVAQTGRAKLRINYLRYAEVFKTMNGNNLVERKR